MGEFESLAWLNGSPTLNAVFLVLAIGSIAFSIFFYLKGKRSKRPVYIQRSYPLIEDSASAIDGLDILYKSTQIERLTLSKLSFWNNGSETIEGSDIAPKDLLRIEIGGNGDIISAHVIFTKRDANNLEIKLENDLLFFSFDFLDQGDGCVFEIYHTASADEQLSLRGTIKGGDPIASGEFKKNTLIEKLFKNLLGWIPTVDKIEGGTTIFRGNTFTRLATAIAIAPLALTIVMIAAPIEFLLSVFNRTPHQYSLEGGKLSNKANSADS